MDFGLQDTVALVVDSHLPIATAAAVSLANEGAILSLTAPDSYHMRHVEIEIARHIRQERFRAVIADLNRERDVHRLVRETLHRQNDVGVLVNPFQGLPPSSAVTLAEENIEPALARNFMSAVRLTREILPHMKRLGEGRIVNLIPCAAIEAAPCDTLSSLSMAPLLAYFKGLAGELAAYNITVNNIIYAGVHCSEVNNGNGQRDQAIHGPNDHTDDNAIPHDAPDVSAPANPTGNDTKANALLPRMAKPHQIGDIVAMIASAQASYLTGANIILDGGSRRQYYA